MTRFDTLAAGILVRAGRRHDSFLLLERDDGFWSVPGGYLDDYETPKTAALREFKEETGVSLDAQDVHYLCSQFMLNGEGVFAIYICDVESPFHFRLSREHKDGGWFTEASLPRRLYPGLARLLR